MKLTKYSVVLFTLFALLTTPVFAATSAPLLTVKTTTTRMLHALRKNKRKLRNRKVIHSIVRKIVLPKMDVTAIARSVVGRQAWLKASSQTRKKFIRLFTSYVINMYSSALSSYSDEKIHFKGQRLVGKRRAQVFSTIERSTGASNISLNYRLVKRTSGWKIYDFSVSNVSMVNSYSSQFSDTLNQDGLKGLVAKLQTRKR